MVASPFCRLLALAELMVDADLRAALVAKVSRADEVKRVKGANQGSGARLERLANAAQLACLQEPARLPMIWEKEIRFILMYATGPFSIKAVQGGAKA
jgi:hypothetical protein